jgi:hypothetical protein
MLLQIRSYYSHDKNVREWPTSSGGGEERKGNLTHSTGVICPDRGDVNP